MKLSADYGEWTYVPAKTEFSGNIERNGTAFVKTSAASSHPLRLYVETDLRSLDGSVTRENVCVQVATSFDCSLEVKEGQRLSLTSASSFACRVLLPKTRGEQNSGIPHSPNHTPTQTEQVSDVIRQMMDRRLQALGFDLSANEREQLYAEESELDDDDLLFSDSDDDDFGPGSMEPDEEMIERETELDLKSEETSEEPTEDTPPTEDPPTSPVTPSGEPSS